MLSEITTFQKIYLRLGRTDLRKGIDGLASLVYEEFGITPFQKDVLFLFCGARQDRFKGLCWEGTGFVLLYKRLEAGRIKWPRDTNELASISLEEFRRLLDGMTILEKPTVQEATCTRIF